MNWSKKTGRREVPLVYGVAAIICLAVVETLSLLKILARGKKSFYTKQIFFPSSLFRRDSKNCVMTILRLVA
jgi:hypothetical protein